MRLTTNDKLIERRSKIARYATFAGLAVLLGSLVTSFTGNFPILYAYILLIVGFGLAYVGALLANKWIKEPRADTALARALKGMDNKFHLYNYVLPASHVLLTPSGLYVFRVKPNDGKITCRGDKWSSPFRWSRLFGGMGQEPVGNPTTDLRDEMETMKKFVADHMEKAEAIPVDGYIVFSDSNAQLNIEDCSMPAVRVGDLKDSIRKGRRGAALAPALYEELGKTLDEQANAKTA